MITLTTLLTEYLDSTKDSSAANMERGVRKINQAHKLICGSDNYWWLEKVYTINTVVSQSDYYLPVDLRKVKAVRTQTGNKMYIVQEIADPVAFDKLQYFSNNQTSTIPVYYHIFGNKIQLFPRSAAIQPLYIEYIARPIDMTQQDYTKGMTNVLTQGDETVTGTSTTWSTDNIKAGSYMIIDDEAYQISSVTSDTALELVEAYQGTTTSVDQPYVICDIPLVPQDFCEVLWLSATRDYYLKKEDPTVYKMYTDRYLEAEARLKSNTKQKSVENVIHVRRRYNLNPNWFPQITPTP